MKRFLLTCVVILSVSAIKAEAIDWAALTNIFSTAAATNTAVNTTADNQSTNALNALTSIQQQASAIDTEVQNNFLSIVSLISTKKETNSIKSQLTSIMSDSAKTDSEKTELVNQILTAYVSTLSNNSSTTSTLNKLSASQKIELVKQIASLEQSSQKYASLAKQAITTSASNVLTSSSSSNTTASDIASIISQTNQTASLIKTKAANTLNTANQFRTIAKLAGITQ